MWAGVALVLVVVCARVFMCRYGDVGTVAGARCLHAVRVLRGSFLGAVYKGTGPGVTSTETWPS